MREWPRQNWTLIAWYIWVAMLICGMVYFLFG
jgi:Mg2+ and Co2+ transporter CorA